jgi:hypothetical protein
MPSRHCAITVAQDHGSHFCINAKAKQHRRNAALEGVPPMLAITQHWPDFAARQIVEIQRRAVLSALEYPHGPLLLCLCASSTFFSGAITGTLPLLSRVLVCPTSPRHTLRRTGRLRPS